VIKPETSTNLRFNLAYSQQDVLYCWKCCWTMGLL